ncbi:unnamed protein product [Brachionus calyciflorus]|uniref:Uncharacterized protein n=1 Tax=Brachionus calyciflorus TaxID=104777 RepID=A0A814IWK6_9BILA|nr:unnamed protein product [Brachionus calyciflorus]
MNKHFKKRDINWSECIQLTLNFMIENGLNDLKPGEMLSNKNGIWGRLSEIVFQEPFCQSNALFLSKNWERDRNGFRTSILSILNSKEKNDNGAVNCFQFRLSKTEWDDIQKFISKDKNKRQYFTSEFDHVISKTLQENGIKCWVYNNFNYFLKKTAFLWKGEFICRECKIKFLLTLSRNDDNKNFLVSWSKDIQHEIFVIPTKIKIKGEKRIRLGYELKSKGTTNYIAETNNLQKDSINKSNQVFRKIVSEFNHRHQLSKHFIIDAEASKNTFDKLLQNEDDNKITGYIQVINHNPFGIILQSDIQAKLWSIFREEYPVWHFDATGKIMVDLPRQNQILLFTLLARGPVDNQTRFRERISVADFLTTSTDGLSIEFFLKKIIDNFKGYCFFKLPKIIVTDFSWANINAILEACNNCKPIHYLNWSFKLIVEKNDLLRNIIPVKIYLCSTHLLKNVSDDFKKLLKNSDNIRLKRDFIFGFSFLQNSISLNEFNEVLIALYNIYNRKHKNDKLNDFLAFLKLKKSTKDINWLQNIANSDRSINDNFKSEEFFFPDQEIESYKIDSPFTAYFETILENEEKKIILENMNDVNKVKNEFFCPKLFGIIRKRLHVMPFWTGILIHASFKDFKTRLTNNSIESWFDYLKNDVLHENKRINIKRRCYPNEVAAPLYNIIKIKFEKFKSDFEKLFGKYDKIKTSPKDFEMWDFPEEKKRNKRRNSKSLIEYEDNISQKQISNMYNDCFQSREEEAVFIDEEDDCQKNYVDVPNLIFFNIRGIKISIQNVKNLLEAKCLNDTQFYYEIMSKETKRRNSDSVIFDGNNGKNSIERVSKCFLVSDSQKANDYFENEKIEVNGLKNFIKFLKSPEKKDNQYAHFFNENEKITKEEKNDSFYEKIKNKSFEIFENISATVFEKMSNVVNQVVEMNEIKKGIKGSSTPKDNNSFVLDEIENIQSSRNSNNLIEAYNEIDLLNNKINLMSEENIQKVSLLQNDFQELKNAFDNRQKEKEILIKEFQENEEILLQENKNIKESLSEL